VSFFQFLVYFIAIPIVYIFMIAMIIFLIIIAKNVKTRWLSIVGVFGGILFALIFVILDVTTTGLADLSIDPTNILVVSPFAVIGLVAGFFTLLVIDLFVAKKLISFVVFSITWTTAVSGYFLIIATDLRGVVAISTVAFLLGIVVYVMFFFERVLKFFKFGSGIQIIDEEKDERWSIK